MGIRGVITTRDVLLNSGLILRCYGPRAYWRCCLAILLQRQTTFLACVACLGA
jgi:hypothetical protein